MAWNSSNAWVSSDADCSSGANSWNAAHQREADAQWRGAPTQWREEKKASAYGLHQPHASAPQLKQPPGLAVHPTFGIRVRGERRWLKNFRRMLKQQIRKAVEGTREPALALHGIMESWIMDHGIVDQGQHASRMEAVTLFQTKLRAHRLAAERLTNLDYYNYVEDFSNDDNSGPLSRQERKWTSEWQLQDELAIQDEPPTLPDYSAFSLFIEETQEVERLRSLSAVSAQTGAAAGSTASAPAANAPPAAQKGAATGSTASAPAAKAPPPTASATTRPTTPPISQLPPPTQCNPPTAQPHPPPLHVSTTPPFQTISNQTPNTSLPQPPAPAQAPQAAQEETIAPQMSEIYLTSAGDDRNAAAAHCACARTAAIPAFFAATSSESTAEDVFKGAPSKFATQPCAAAS